MVRTRYFLLLTAAMLFASSALAQVRPVPNPAVDVQAQDRIAIRSTLEGFAKTFAGRDSKTLSAYWTAQGEYRRGDGAAIQGRAGLEKAFQAFFDKTPEVSAEVQSEALRFLSRDTAIDEGFVNVRRGPTEPATRARYSALLVRDDGRWRIAQLVETEFRGVSINDLAWLIGEWRSVSGSGAEISTTYSWSASRKFIRVEFSIKEKALAISGSQMIGVSPITGQLHSWTFEADGGVGEADWTRDGDHWALEAGGTLVDGRHLTETNVLRRINDDTFTWQSTNRLLDDEELADLPPVKVTRVKTEK